MFEMRALDQPEKTSEIQTKDVLCSNQYISAPLYIENIIISFYKTSYLNEEVSFTEPSILVSIPCLNSSCLGAVSVPQKKSFITLSTDFFLCASGEQCYRYWDYCDHEAHCDDGSDEGTICQARDYIVFVVPALMLLVPIS
jgi:hypothetical protein